MGQTTNCDICKEIIKPSDKKFIFALYPVTEEAEETKKLRFREMLDALYEGKAQGLDKSIKVAEICNACTGVFAHFMSLRKKELIKARREVRKIFARKTYRDKKKEERIVKGKKKPKGKK